jgi:hypothetical protein
LRGWDGPRVGELVDGRRQVWEHALFRGRCSWVRAHRGRLERLSVAGDRAEDRDDNTVDLKRRTSLFSDCFSPVEPKTAGNWIQSFAC